MKFFGKIGFDLGLVESVPGVWKPTIEERQYYGDVVKDYAKRTSGNQVNDDILIENRFSIVSDGYISEHFSSIVYIEWCGQLWKVTGVEYDRPRITISIGGLYNGDTP